MGKEIEEKFLVEGESWREQVDAGVHYAQGYLSRGETCVRVRLAGEKGILTIKGPTEGITRLEYEYEIPRNEAEEMLRELIGSPIIEKIRYTYANDGLVWEVDEFLGENKGLIVAELELQSEDQAYEKPEWIGECVSHDFRYANSNLVNYPYKDWAL
jgi:CYTH domain-containing protein